MRKILSAPPGQKPSASKPDATLGEFLGLGFLLLCLPLLCLSMMLPVNEYSWMGDLGEVPPDCSITLQFLLWPLGIAGALLALCFGVRFLRTRSRLSALLVGLSLLCCLAVAMRLPELLAELARAREHCG